MANKPARYLALATSLTFAFALAAPTLSVAQTSDANDRVVMDDDDDDFDYGLLGLLGLLGLAGMRRREVHTTHHNTTNPPIR